VDGDLRERQRAGSEISFVQALAVEQGKGGC